MIIPQFHTWIELSRRAFAHNISLFRSIVGPSTQIALVIKGNGYGHGMKEMAQLAQDEQNVQWLYTATLEEALQLRAFGITKPILATSVLSVDPALAIEHDIDVVIYDESAIERLHEVAQRKKKKLNVHVKVDTGLSRFGFLPEHAPDMCERIAQMKYLHIRGIYTHFSSSDDRSLTTTEQLFRFINLLNVLDDRGIQIELYHTNNTAATITAGSKHTNLVRIGAGAYGMWPSEYVRDVVVEKNPDAHLQQVITWKSYIDYIKTVPAGSYVGYARTFCTERETRIAIIPVGYYDGYDRRFSNTGTVLINRADIIGNRYAKVIGRICMNVFEIDITDVPQANVGDEVILLGDYPQLTSRNLADTISSFNPREITTRLNPHIPRIIVK